MDEFMIPYSTANEIPDEELLVLHKKYWEFIAEKGLAEKPVIVGSDRDEIEVDYFCFLCEYDARRKRKTGSRRCDSCPAKIFRGHLCICMMVESPYFKWKAAKTPEDRRKYALEIANLELVEDA